MPRHFIQKLVELSPRAWLTLLEITGVSLFVEVGLRMLPFKRLLGLLSRHPTRQVENARLTELSRLTRAWFRRYPGNLTCLKKALILLTLLRHRGIPTELKIGLAKDGSILQAHAWLEQNGQVMSDAPDVAQDYQAVLSLEAAT